MGEIGGPGRDSLDADAIAPHHDRDLAPLLVQNPGTEAVRVLGAELEDVADLERFEQRERSLAAAGAGFAGLDLAQIDELRSRQIAADVDSFEVEAVGVGAGHHPDRTGKGPVDKQPRDLALAGHDTDPPE